MNWYKVYKTDNDDLICPVCQTKMEQFGVIESKLYRCNNKSCDNEFIKLNKVGGL